MPNIYNNVYKKYNLKKTNIYIETGTYIGRGITKPVGCNCTGCFCMCNPKNPNTTGVLNNYNKIYSIELSEKYYNFNVKQFKSFKNVNIITNNPLKMSAIKKAGIKIINQIKN